MALYKYPDSKIWWYSIWNGRTKKHVRGSTHTDDEGVAKSIEQVMVSAYKRSMPADRLHAMIDILTGSESQKRALMMAGVWEEYRIWLSNSGRELSGTTIRLRKSYCERFAAWAGKDYPSAKTAEDVDRACAAAYSRKLANDGLSGKTRRNIIGDLCTVWQTLKKTRDGISQNPWPLVLPEDDSVRLEPFTPEEEKRIFKAAKKTSWWLACLIARNTGLRYGDVAMLKWEDVDLDTGLITIKPHKTARHGIIARIPVCEALKKALKPLDKSGGWVLPDHAKFYPNPFQGPQGAFSDILEKAGVTREKHTFHSWRHTLRTRLSAAGVSDEIAKRLLGHTNDETSKRYDHNGREADVRSAIESASLS